MGFSARWTLAALAAALCSTLSCDPCAGVVGCSRQAAAVLNGRFIGFPSEKGVAGVRVRVAAAGVQGETWSDRDGFWRVELPTPDVPGVVIARAEVQAPGAPAPYVIEDLRVPVSRRRGDAVDVGRWYATPQLRFVGEVRIRPGISLAGTTVRVDRVGGVGGKVEGVVALVGSDRRFLVEAPATGLGPMLVRLSFRVPGFTEPFVHDSMSVLTMVRDTAANVQGTFSIGAGFLYRIRVMRRGTGAGVSQAVVIFRRRSGPRVIADSVWAVTDAEGYASPPVQPLERGVIVGDLTVLAPGIAPETFMGLRYPTVDDDLARVGGNFMVGARVASVVELFRRTTLTPLAGVPWRFIPDSGPLSTPLNGVTNSWGAATLTAAVGETGSVRGALAVRYAQDQPEELLPDIIIPAVRDDSLRRIAYLGVGPSALYGGTLQDGSSLASIAGATVEFQRRGGVPLTEERFTTTTNELGLFRMFPTPLSDGEVSGDLTFRIPAPYRDTTFVGVRLPTFRSDETRVGPIFRVSGPRGQVAAVIELYRRTSYVPLAGAPWRFIPETGPLQTTISGVTTEFGAVVLRAAIADTGMIRGTLAVRFAADQPEELIGGVEVPSLPDATFRRIAYLGVGPSALYAGALRDADGLSPIAGAVLEFRRRGGVATNAETFTWTTNEIGLFRMFPAPIADGEIVGDLTFRMPSPYRDTTFTDVRLPTFRGDETRVGPTFLVRRP